MFITLYGPDDYRREEKKRTIVSEFKKKHPSSEIAVFSGEEKEAPGKCKDFISGGSLFDAAKLAAIYNPGEGDEKAWAKALKEISTVPNATILLTFNRKPVAAFAQILKEENLVEQFPHLEGAAWERFIATEAERSDVAFSSDALTFLAEAYLHDTWRLVTELKKIASGGVRTVDKKTLVALGIEIAPDSWMTLNALRASSLRTRLDALESLFATHEPSAKLFNILSALEKKRAPFWAAADAAIKSGKIEYEEALLEAALTN
ncbi:MAG: hypothetical protein Q7S28_01030 [bacterium]|nr:hypothetical protein [bacterium]